MAKVTRTIHVKVVTFDPAQRQLVPVPNARLLCEDDSWLIDTNLSSGNDTTDANGLVNMDVSFDDTEERSLNPYFTITIPQANRAVPAAATAAKQFNLPDEWVTRHYVNHRIPRIGDFTDPNRPLTLFVGLHGRMRVGYTDFDPSNKRNPVALPEDTVRIYLADYDDFLWIDFLNPDDTMQGFGYNPKTGHTIPVGEGEEYPYFDTWPTAPLAFDGLPAAPRAWIDPPGSPVGSLGGGSFEHAGPLAVDPHGFVFMIDGNVVRHFYPDGTLCETIEEWFNGVTNDRFNAPGGLALDQYRNLFVADSGNHRVVFFKPRWQDDTSGQYTHLGTFGSNGAGSGQFDQPLGLAVVPNAVVDGEEFLAVADSRNSRVQVFRITLSNPTVSNRAISFPSVGLTHHSSFGTAGAAAGQFDRPAGVGADRRRRIFVCDRGLHRVSRWGFNAASNSYAHELSWEKTGGGSGAGNREFNAPEALSVDTKNGYVYVAESGNRRVQRLDSDSGNHLANWAHTYAPALANPFTPTAVASDSRGETYVADTANQRVLRGTTFDAAGTRRNDGDAPNVVGSAWTPRSERPHMLKPTYLCFAPDGKLWVSDSGNNRVFGFERNALGELELMASAPPSTGLTSPIGGLSNPVGVAVDPEGNLFVVDSDNHRVRKYNAALAYQSDLGTGAGGNAANEFNHPRGIVIVQRVEPLLYVADRDNDRVQVLKRDGTFLRNLTTYGPDRFDKPEDVAADSRGNVYVLDTGHGRVVQFDASDNFVRSATITIPNSVPAGTSRLTGLSVDDADKLIITDQGHSLILRTEVDGTVLSFWDLRGLLRQKLNTSPPDDEFYYPEQARMILFDGPTRAVLDDRGLLAVADTQHNRVRLVRTYTDLQVNLFDLGEGQPDISFRAVTKADWSNDLALKLNVGDVSIFDDSHDFISDPLDDFADDEYEHRQMLGAPRHTNAAINAMKVVRQVQRWCQHNTRQGDQNQRWGSPATAALLDAGTLNVDLISGNGSNQFLDVNLGNEESGSPHGRGADSWDDAVVAHEMAHWIFGRMTLPYPILPLNPFRWVDLSRSHSIQKLMSHNQVLSEGWADYIGIFWGLEFGSTDRVRGISMSAGHTLTFVRPDDQAANRRYIFGGLSSNPLPTFDDPGGGTASQGYFTNALYQIHCMLIDPEVMFADSPSYWHAFNANISDDQSKRYYDTMWRALRRFHDDPPFRDRASEVFLTKLLDQFQTAQPSFAQMAQSIFELNNLLMPTVFIAADGSPNTPLGDRIDVGANQSRGLIAQVRDATGRELRGYNLCFNVGSSAHYAFAGGAGPIVRRGVRPAPGAAPVANEIFRATNATGGVPFTFNAPAAAGTTDTLTVSYQPDFDNDETFAPPERGDDLETTLRKLYLYELRTVAKSWPGVGNNFGAKVSRRLEIRITA